MTSPVTVTDDEVELALCALPGWVRSGDELRCSYRLPAFMAAVAFTQRIALLAEELVHHPEWTVRYRRVDVLTTTHDVGGLSQLDLRLARQIVALAVEAGAEVVDVE